MDRAGGRGRGVYEGCLRLACALTAPGKSGGALRADRAEDKWQYQVLYSFRAAETCGWYASEVEGVGDECVLKRVL